MKSLSKYIKEALSKELKTEKNRLWNRAKGMTALELWKYLTNEKCDEFVSYFEGIYAEIEKMYKYKKDDYSSIDDYMLNYNWIIMDNCFKSRKAYIDFLKELFKSKNKKEFLLSKDVLDNLNTSRESDIYNLQHLLDEYDFEKAAISYIGEIEDEWCVHFMMCGKEWKDGFKPINNGKRSYIDNYLSVLKSGFKLGTPYPTEDKAMELYTASHVDKEKHESDNSINFAYELEYAKYNFREVAGSFGKQSGYKSKYGFLGLVFKTDGIVIYHRHDGEYQVLFNGKTAKDLTPIYADYSTDTYGIITNIQNDNDSLKFDWAKQFDTWADLMSYFTGKSYEKIRYKIEDKPKEEPKSAFTLKEFIKLNKLPLEERLKFVKAVSQSTFEKIFENMPGVLVQPDGVVVMMIKNSDNKKRKIWFNEKGGKLSVDWAIMYGDKDDEKLKPEFNVVKDEDIDTAIEKTVNWLKKDYFTKQNMKKQNPAGF